MIIKNKDDKCKTNIKRYIYKRLRRLNKDRNIFNTT